LKAVSGTEVIAVGNTADTNDVQYANELQPIDDTDDGSVNDVREVHPTKAALPIYVTEEGMDKYTMATQSLNL